MTIKLCHMVNYTRKLKRCFNKILLFNKINILINVIMIRTALNTSTGKIEFVRDNYVDYLPLVNTSMGTNNVFIDDMNLMPRTIIRTNPSYQTVNNDPELRKKVVKYFFTRLSEDWLFGAFNDVNKYLTVKDGKVDIVKSLKDVGKSGDMTDLKVEFVLEEVFTKHDLLEVIDKYVRHRNVNWYDLKTEHKGNLKDYIHGKLKSHMRKLIADA